MLIYINKASSDELLHQAKTGSKPLFVISSCYACGGNLACSGRKGRSGYGTQERSKEEEERLDRPLVQVCLLRAGGRGQERRGKIRAKTGVLERRLKNITERRRRMDEKM